MEISLYQELAALLANTEELLACAEPSLTAWQGYVLRRVELFHRLQVTPRPKAESKAAATALQQLISELLEKDQLLVLKIRQHMSKISRQRLALADGRRLFNAYVLGVQPAPSCYLHTA